jgi:hypothetical protein
MFTNAVSRLQHTMAALAWQPDRAPEPGVVATSWEQPARAHALRLVLWSGKGTETTCLTHQWPVETCPKFQGAGSGFHQQLDGHARATDALREP